MRLSIFSMVAVCAVFASQFASAANEPTDLSWPTLTRENKPWARWWWLGSAVDQPNLKLEMEQLASRGFGGVEITPLYGAVGFEERYLDFLSPKYMQMLEFTGNEAKRLEMGVDMATGTGWPFGGPWISPENADAQLVRNTTKLEEKPTRMKVKRAAPGDDGFVVNPFSPSAMAAYLKPFTEPFDKFPHGLIRSQFHDSFEYSGNWSHELPAKFKQMHGYDLADHAKELWGEGDPDTVSRVLSDYRATLGQMHLDYLKVWVKWSHDHGMLARNQAHGSPGNLLDLYAVADIPETETFGSTLFPIPGFRRDPGEISNNVPNPLIARFASSAAHVSGKNLASCETFTWLREHFKATLSEMKPEADQMFLSGINHLIYHGSCYSPQDAKWPGWNFYASVEFTARNTLWHDLPAMNAYYARVQSILQAGKPDNDLLVYWPIFDVFSQPSNNGNRPNINLTVHNQFVDGSSLGNAGKWLTEHGYSFDYISDAQLLERDALAPYRAILVPTCKAMPPATLEKLLALAKSGQTILFEDALPSDVPGFADVQGRLKSLNASRDALSADKEHVLVGKLDAIIPKAGVSREAMADSGLKFIRRSHDAGHHYFIVNQTAGPIEGWFPLSVATKSAAILDPLTSHAGLAATRRGTSSQTEVFLRLAPDESMILRTFKDNKIDAEPWKYLTPDGDGTTLAGTWNVEFLDGGGPEKPASFKTDKLDSWTTLGDDNAKRFGGTAKYTLEFDAPAASGAASPTDWTLDLGDVRESARVAINGKAVATLWSIPFRTSVGEYIQPGKNKLEIEVTNLAANRIRDMDTRKIEWKKFHEINFVNIQYRPFDASSWELAPSGLLGPVRLIPLKAAMP